MARQRLEAEQLRGELSASQLIAANARQVLKT